MKIKPLADRVLVEPSAAETKTASGIIIPDTAQEKPQKGKIVAAVNETISKDRYAIKNYKYIEQCYHINHYLEQRDIYYQRFSGLFNAIIGKNSWYRPKIT